MRVLELFEAREQTMFEVPDVKTYIVERKSWNSVRVIGEYESVTAVKKAIKEDYLGFKDSHPHDRPTYLLLYLTDKEITDWGKPTGHFFREYIGEIYPSNPLHSLLNLADADTEVRKKLENKIQMLIKFEHAAEAVPFK